MKGDKEMSDRAGNVRYVVEGSVVRRINEAPARRVRPEIEPQRRRETENRKKSVPVALDRALAFDVKYTIFVVASVAIMIAACVAMLYMESKVSEQKRNISGLTSQLEEAQTDNASYKASIDSMYTLDEIYDVATNELGMVYARSGQIIYYESANEDYVKQYKSVPEAD